MKLQLKSSPPLKSDSGIGGKHSAEGIETRGKPVSSGKTIHVPTGDADQPQPTPGNPVRAHYQMATKGI